jgi:FkbM family methyltransferase
MTTAAGLLTRASSRLAAVLPERLTAGAIRAVYPRVEPELARLASFAPAGGTAVDVGAWYGPWTARLRRIADRVVAVEPNAQLADCVQAAFPDVRVVRAVVSDHTGQAELHLPAGGPAVGTSSIEYGDGPSITVPRTTIDALGLTDVRFVKLDVEGHDPAGLADPAGRGRGADPAGRADRRPAARLGLPRLRAARPGLAPAGQVRPDRPPAGQHRPGPAELRPSGAGAPPPLRQLGAVPEGLR